MYNRSPRMGKLIKGETPDNVGPTTYILEECPPPREGYCPFLSCTPRKFAIGLNVYTEAQYNASTPRNIKGGTIPKAARFSKKYQKSAKGRGKKEEVEDTGPGPGSYNLKPQSKKCPFMDPTPIPGKGRLYVCRPPFYVKGATAPSIPTKIDENGYEICEDGVLIKRPCNVYDDSLGPAYYNVSTKPCWNSRRYTGCAWSKKLAKRKSFEGNDNPSPLDYDTTVKCCQSSKRDEEFRELARLFTFIPRFAEATELRTLSEDMPGPASYDVSGSTLRNVKSMSIRPVPMVTGAKRFKATAETGPGPGTYDPLPKRTNLKGYSPFNVDAARFQRKILSESPGPARYDVPSPIQERLCHKLNVYSMVDAPFNHTAKRKLSFVNPDQYHMPGAADYPEVAAASDIPTLPISGPTFRSRVNRFPTEISEQAEPATYSISKAFNASRNKKSHSAGNVPFNQSNPRPSLYGRASNNPAPDTYYTEVGMRDWGTYFNCEFPRFACSKEDNPAPNAYQLSMEAVDSCHKAYNTHNVKLLESVQRRNKNKPKPKELVKIRRKAKVLRWFVQPSADYKHCLFVM